MNNNFEELKKRIIEDVKSKVYTNKLINYQEFLELYTPYMLEIEEKEFAEIIGITYDNWISIRNRGTRTRIKIQQDIVKLKDRKEQIKKEIESLGIENKSITYEEFLQLYDKYKHEISESDFAEIIGISYSNLKNMRNINTKAIVLKTSDEPITEKGKNEIIEKVKNLGYGNKLINYDDFLKIYEPFKTEIAELTFAKIIGIPYINWTRFKNGTRRVRILKGSAMTPEKDNKSNSANKSTIQTTLVNIEQIKEKISDNATPIEVMKICFSNGMTRSKTINYCMKRFNLSRRELINIITESLQNRNDNKGLLER